MKIAFGTDQGVAPHGENAKEFGYLVEAGMPALVAIRAATLDAATVLDATDRLEFPKETASASTVEFGIAPQLAALEALINPSVDELMALDDANSAGTLEIIPPEAPLVLFVWGKNRVQAVKVVSLSITEEAFDTTLSPTQAKVSLDLQVMSTDDLGFAHRGGGIFMSHLKKRELMARAAGPATLSSIGLTRLP